MPRPSDSEIWPMPICSGPWQFPNAVVSDRVLGSLGQEPEVQDIVCPASTSVKADAQGNVWCEDAAGTKLPATLKPAKTASAGISLGPIGWAAIISAALLGGAALFGGKRRRR